MKPYEGIFNFDKFKRAEMAAEKMRKLKSEGKRVNVELLAKEFVVGACTIRRHFTGTVQTNRVGQSKKHQGLCKIILLSILALLRLKVENM